MDFLPWQTFPVPYRSAYERMFLSDLLLWSMEFWNWFRDFWLPLILTAMSCITDITIQGKSFHFRLEQINYKGGKQERPSWTFPTAPMDGFFFIPIIYSCSGTKKSVKIVTFLDTGPMKLMFFRLRPSGMYCVSVAYWNTRMSLLYGRPKVEMGVGGRCLVSWKSILPFCRRMWTEVQVAGTGT